MAKCKESPTGSRRQVVSLPRISVDDSKWTKREGRAEKFVLAKPEVRPFKGLRKEKPSST